MATTGAEAAAPSLPTVRRFEAAGFRAWPASSVHYDGTWAIRLTAGLAAKRLNSINPLDPSDGQRIDVRIARATRRFEAYGRPLLFRLTPLAPAALSGYLAASGWERFGECKVMTLDLGAPDFDRVMDILPVRDIARFLDGALQVMGTETRLRPGLSEIIDSIAGEAGLFLSERDSEPVSTAICVRDGDLAGLFEVATEAGFRARGHGRAIVMAALKWARLHGAGTAWLQVEAANAAAVHLYRSIGFREIYRYHYWRPGASS